MSIKNAMEKRMRAGREKTAMIKKAEGERRKLISIS
jgi:regulator of protease activity HflC (stomatin/prohibitin superfamily)